MGRRNYTQADHKTAFESWLAERNYSTASKKVGSNWETVRRWSKPEFACPYACPWHDWVRLADERERAHAVRMKLLNQGNTDPVDHDAAMRNELAKAKTAAIEPHYVETAAIEIVRSDIERLSHWEYLWSKVYYDATGHTSDWRHFRGLEANGVANIENKLREQLRGGLHATSLDHCVRMLATIQEQIDKLQGAARRAPKVAAQDGKPASLEELREMRKMIKSTPPTKLATMLTVMRAEDGEEKASASAS